MMDCIVYQFLACTPIKNINWKQFKTDEQIILYDKIFKHNIILKGFHPSVNYQLSFLKKWIHLVEEERKEVIENIYQLYTELISTPNDNEYCYKSYHLGNEIFVTLKECTCLISQGTTGLHTWQASMYLTEWIAENKGLFDDKHVVELGSGAGLLGLATLKLTQLKSYTFTDTNTSVLDLLSTNIAANNQRSDIVQVMQLDWNNYNNELTDTTIDYILATDVIYDIQLIDPFIHILETLINGSNAVAIVASIIRNEDTFSHFTKQLSHSSLSFEELSLSSNEIFYFQRISNVSILQLTKQ